MKRAILLLLVFTMLLAAPCASLAAGTAGEAEVKETVKAYFDLRYKALSTLAFDEGIKNLLSPDILRAEDAINEGVSSRKEKRNWMK